MTTQASTNRATIARIRATLAAVTGAAAVVVALCGYSALARVGQPFAGFFVWENGFVPAIGLSSIVAVLGTRRSRS